MKRLLLLLLAVATLPACRDAYAGMTWRGHDTQTDGGVTVGTGGTAITLSLSASAVIDFANIVTLSCLANTMTLTGVAVNDPVACSWPAAVEDGLAGTCWVSATNTISFRLCNVTVGSIDPASGTYAARIIR